MSAESVGEEVLSARQDAGLTQRDLADLLGVHVTAIGKIERGERVLSWEEGRTLQIHIGFAATADTARVAKEARAYESIRAIVHALEGE